MSSSFLHGESIETSNQHVDFLKRNEYKYRKFFKDHDSYETFMMLPVSEHDRVDLLHKLIEEERQRLSGTPEQPDCKSE